MAITSSQEIRDQASMYLNMKFIIHMNTMLHKMQAKILFLEVLQLQIEFQILEEVKKKQN